MALTSTQFQAWLEDSNAKRCMLVEVVVNIAGIETTLYLSNKNYVTGPAETPANITYLPFIQNSLAFTQAIPIDGSASLSYGDIAIDNTNGDRDSWLNYIWANRQISIYIGDITFARTDFTKIYSGYVSDIASSDRNTINISIRDLLQKLNTPITSTLIGGTSQNKEQLRPLVFGEVHNITPVLFDAANLIYMVHNGPIESIIEVRDNGVPLVLGVSYTVNLTSGTFTLLRAPIGTITCSVQGERSTINPITGNVLTGNYTTTTVSWTRATTTATVTHTAHGMLTGATIYITSSSDLAAVPSGVYTITVTNSNTYTIVVPNAGSNAGTVVISTYTNTVARLIQIIVSKYGTIVLNSSDMDISAINTFDSNNQAPVGIYVTSNTNVINVCQDLASAVGAQFTSNRNGLVTILKIDTPSAVGQTKYITDTDIVFGSLTIDQKIPIQGAIKLGYCQNWTIQNTLLTGIPEAHKTMFAMEYLTATVKDSAILTQYNLSNEPEIKNTSMVSNSGTIPYVTNEANRLLSLWKVPRFVYRMECTAKFLNISLGEMVSLTHYRFGLSGSKYGQVISISTNWDTGRVNLGILV